MHHIPVVARSIGACKDVAEAVDLPVLRHSREGLQDTTAHNGNSRQAQIVIQSLVVNQTNYCLADSAVRCRQVQQSTSCAVLLG